MVTDRSQYVWKKSSRSEQSLNCVEIAGDGATVLMRDSKDPAGAVLSFDTIAWRGFVADVKLGDFDRR